MRLFDSLFVLRPTLMFPLLTMILVGYHIAPVKMTLGWQRWALLTVAFCALFGLGYLLNQLRDRVSDRHNGKLFLIDSEALSRRHLRLEAVLLTVCAPLALIAAGFGHIVLWAAVMFLVGGILYNYSPLALQDKPWGGILAGLVGGWLLLRVGGALAGEPGSWWREAPYIIAFTSACLLTTLPDREGDLYTGKMTFAVVYGARATITFALTGFLLAALWGILGRDWVIALPAAASFPILLIGRRLSSVPLAVKANKVAIFALSLMVGLFYPLYLAVIVLYYPLARWYYRHRFGLNYPSFRGE